MKVILSTLNAKYIHTSLAIRLLKAYSGQEFDIDLAEYTIKDPATQAPGCLLYRLLPKYGECPIKRAFREYYRVYLKLKEEF